MRIKEYVNANLGALALLVDTMKKVEGGRINYRAAAKRLESFQARGRKVEEISKKDFEDLLNEFFNYRPEKKSRPVDAYIAFAEYYRSGDGTVEPV